MSTATVSSPKRSKSKGVNAAKWDDEKSGLLLEVLDNEINQGNRPGGVYSKTAWFNIVNNFKQRTGLDYNKDQIKNRMNNLRRDYIRWDKLIGRETGLGWNYQKRMLAAPDQWWYDKAKVDSSILKYKDGGPIHLDLMQRVFGGVTATGAHRYNPGYNDPDPIQEGTGPLETQEDIIDFTVDESPAVLIEQTPVMTPNVVPSTSQLNPRKRARSNTTARASEVDKFGAKIDSLTDTIKESMTSYAKARSGEEDSSGYLDALNLLTSMPGMGPDNPVFIKAVRVLEHRLRRVAFKTMLHFGDNAVLAWLRTFPDEEYGTSSACQKLYDHYELVSNT